MCMSLEKSSFLFNETDELIINSISALLPYKMFQIDEVFKYLGYHLIPTNYGTKD